jgi:hypothetical protein
VGTAGKQNLRDSAGAQDPEGGGGWTFAPVPDAHAPPVTHGWGRTPVYARVDGHGWQTSVWRDKKLGTLLPVPKAVRADKGDGDMVVVEILPPRRKSGGPRRQPG